MAESKNAELRKELDTAITRVHELEKALGVHYTLENSQELMKITIEQMLEGIQIIDRKWRYIFMNDAAARHGHLEKHQALGKTMMDCYPGIDATNMFKVLRTVATEAAPRQFENLFEYPDGSQC